jgi:hypothetical protein
LPSSESPTTSYKGTNGLQPRLWNSRFLVFFPQDHTTSGIVIVIVSSRSQHLQYSSFLLVRSFVCLVIIVRRSDQDQPRLISGSSPDNNRSAAEIGVSWYWASFRRISTHSLSAFYLWGAAQLTIFGLDKDFLHMLGGVYVQPWRS